MDANLAVQRVFKEMTCLAALHSRWCHCLLAASGHVSFVPKNSISIVRFGTLIVGHPLDPKPTLDSACATPQHELAAMFLRVRYLYNSQTSVPIFLRPRRARVLKGHRHTKCASSTSPHSADHATALSFHPFSSSSSAHSSSTTTQFRVLLSPRITCCRPLRPRFANKRASAPRESVTGGAATTIWRLRRVWMNVVRSMSIGRLLS
jgi:hypothetical protein